MIVMMVMVIMMVVLRVGYKWARSVAKRKKKKKSSLDMANPTQPNTARNPLFFPHFYKLHEIW